MSLAMRVETLESEVFQIKKAILHRDENQHKIWNDMQEKIHDLCKENAERLDGVEGRLVRVEKRLDAVENRLTNIEADVAVLKSDMGEVKAMLQQLLDR